MCLTWSEALRMSTSPASLSLQCHIWLPFCSKMESFFLNLLLTPTENRPSQAQHLHRLNTFESASSEDSQCHNVDSRSPHDKEPYNTSFTVRIQLALATNWISQLTLYTSTSIRIVPHAILSFAFTFKRFINPPTHSHGHYVFPGAQCSEIEQVTTCDPKLLCHGHLQEHTHPGDTPWWVVMY